MRQYLDLCEHILTNGVKKKIVQELEPLVRSDIKCASIFPKVFL